MILYQSQNLPDDMEERIIADSKKAFTPITAYTLVNGSINGYFYKKINMPKVKERFRGNYVAFLLEYYEKIKKYIKCNKIVAIFERDGNVYEVSDLIDNNSILCDNNNVSYEEIRNLFRYVLFGINELEKSGDVTLGIDSAIWNYTKDGLFFDYDPPKILKGDSLFITPDEDYRQRVLYRNFSYTGMKANTLGTIILGNKNWNFNITDLPDDYLEELLEIMFLSFHDENELKKIRQEIYGEHDNNAFDKHPVNIIRRELKK